MREYPVNINSDWTNPCCTVYDNVVRKDSFRPDAETIKDFNASGMSKGSGSGVFDFTDGKPHNFEEVSPELIALRENRMDKTEIELMKNKFKKDANKEINNNNVKAEFEKASKMAKARDEAIDTILGVSSEEE